MNVSELLLEVDVICGYLGELGCVFGTCILAISNRIQMSAVKCDDLRDDISAY